MSPYLTKVKDKKLQRNYLKSTVSTKDNVKGKLSDGSWLLMVEPIDAKDDFNEHRSRDYLQTSNNDRVLTIEKTKEMSDKKRDIYLDVLQNSSKYSKKFEKEATNIAREWIKDYEESTGKKLTPRMVNLNFDNYFTKHEPQEVVYVSVPFVDENDNFRFEACMLYNTKTGDIYETDISS